MEAFFYCFISLLARSHSTEGQEGHCGLCTLYTPECMDVCGMRGALSLECVSLDQDISVTEGTCQ